MPCLAATHAAARRSRGPIGPRGAPSPLSDADERLRQRSSACPKSLILSPFTLGPSGVDFRFRCAALRMDAAELAALGDDCSLIFEKQQGSNWLPATAAPRCALERLALAVLEQWL